MTDAATGAGTSALRILAGTGSGEKGAVAAAPAGAVASVAADGMRLAIAAALSAGTITLLPSRGGGAEDEPAAASAVRAPARPRTASAMSVRVRMSGFSFRSAAEADDVVADIAGVLRVEGAPAGGGIDAARWRRRRAGNAVEEVARRPVGIPPLAHHRPLARADRVVDLGE